MTKLILIFKPFVWLTLLNLFLFFATGKSQTTLQIKVLLEGPWEAGLMSTSLNSSGQIPFLQPFGKEPWNYYKQDRVNEIPSGDIVDWILVDLLQPVVSANDTLFQIIDRKAGFLDKNGFIKDLDGQSDLQFLATHDQGFFVKISHRNHIPVVSSVSLPLSGEIFTYDFTIDANAAIGGDQIINQLSNDSWAMVSGDGDGSFHITNEDKNEVWLPEHGLQGYYAGDFDNDGLVDIYDKHLHWGSNSGMGYDIEVACCQPITEFKHIYLANDNHTDYFWSGDADAYRDVFLNELDYYLEKADQTLNNPLPYQSRFNCDVAMYVYTYKQYRSETAFNHLINRIKSGHISMPYNMLVLTYGGQPTEAVLRGMYWQERLARKHDLDIKMAVSMENQTLPLGLASLWAGAGAFYSWKGVCGCASGISTSKLENRDNEIYRYLGPDQRGLVMKWYSLSEDYGNNGQGGYAEARIPANSIIEMSNKCNSPDYPFHIAGAFGHAHDALQKTTQTFVTNAQNGSNSDRQVYVSNEEDFFDHFLSLFPENSLPIESVSYGNEWDLDCASMAGPTADVKIAMETLRGAEAMAAVITAEDTAFYPAYDPDREKAWVALGSYWEHDFGIGGCCTDERAIWQNELRDDITGYVGELMDTCIQRMGELIIKTGTNDRFFAFNPLGWSRHAVADIAYSGSEDITVYDVTASAVMPHQIINREGVDYLRVYCEYLPSVGYKVYEIENTSSTNNDVTATFDGTVFENDFYRLEITPAGTITSLKDKLDNDREYVMETDNRFVNDFGQGSSLAGSIALLDNGPVSATVECVSSVPLQHTTRITLYKSIKRVDIENTINDVFGDEIRTYSFSFNVENSQIHHEELGAVLNVNYKDNGGDYANPDQPVNYNWLTLNHFVSADNDNYGIKLSNSSASFMKVGNSSTDFIDSGSSQINVLIGGRMGGSGPGIANQFGNTIFTNDFSLQTQAGGFNATESMKFSLEHQNQPITGIITGTNGSLPFNHFSLLRITDSENILWSIKPAEEGYAAAGIIARVWNLRETVSECELDFAFPIKNGAITTHLETDILSLPHHGGDLPIRIDPLNMQSFRVFLSAD